MAVEKNGDERAVEKQISGRKESRFQIGLGAGRYSSKNSV